MKDNIIEKKNKRIDMKDIYKKIKFLTEKQDKPVEKCLCKLTEEVGELAQTINKSIGMKKHKISDIEIRKEVKEECADVIQNVISIMIKYNISWKEVKEEMINKNSKWEKNVIDK